MSDLDQLLGKIEQLESASQKRGSWQPEQQGTIDIRIAVDGSWYHEGRMFQRLDLVKLFARILRKEQTGYFLVTPVEKLAIQVDDAPFVASLLEQVESNGQQALVFTTNLGEKVVADDRHPIRVDIDPASKEPRPYILVRDQLEALIGRNAFYEMLNLARASERNGKQVLTIHSMDTEILLGTIDTSEQNK